MGKEAKNETQVSDGDHAQPLREPARSPANALAPLLHERSARLTASLLPEVVIGELVALADQGLTPLIVYPGQGGAAALRARSVLDLRGEHIGKPVVLAFENGDASLPIVMGMLRDAQSRPLDAPGHVQLDADGERMIVAARDQLVLKCGDASITLTKAGKVLIEGSYVSSHSTGANCIKGGSVQLN